MAGAHLGSGRLPRAVVGDARRTQPRRRPDACRCRRLRSRRRRAMPTAADGRPGLNETVAAPAFPPAALLALADSSPDDIVFVLPVKVRSSDWGLLCVVGPDRQQGRVGSRDREPVGGVAHGRARPPSQRRLARRAARKGRTLLRTRTRPGRRHQDERRALRARGGGGERWPLGLGSGRRTRCSTRRAGRRCSTAAKTRSAPARTTGSAGCTPKTCRICWPRSTNHLAGRSSGVELEHRIRREDGSYLWVLCRALVIRGADGVPDPHGRLDHRRPRPQGTRRTSCGTRRCTTRSPACRTARLFLDRLRLTMARAGRRADYQYAVLFLDLDGFKLVNDSLGHLLGDSLLSSVAERISADLRPSDTASRFGGDEFAILLDDIVSTAQSDRGGRTPASTTRPAVPHRRSRDRGDREHRHRVEHDRLPVGRRRAA